MKVSLFRKREKLVNVFFASVVFLSEKNKKLTKLKIFKNCWKKRKKWLNKAWTSLDLVWTLTHPVAKFTLVWIYSALIRQNLFENSLIDSTNPKWLGLLLECFILFLSYCIMQICVNQDNFACSIGSTTRESEAHAAFFHFLKYQIIGRNHRHR